MHEGVTRRVIRADCLSPQDETFRRVAELTSPVFTRHGIRSDLDLADKCDEEEEDHEEDHDQEDEASNEDNCSESSLESIASSTDQDWGEDWKGSSKERKEKRSSTKVLLNSEEKKSFFDLFWWPFPFPSSL